MLPQRIYELKKYVTDKRFPFLDDLASIEDDFNRMTDFYAQGNIDPELDSVYEALKRRVQQLETNVQLYGLSQGNPFYQKMIADMKGNYTLDLEELRTRLEDFAIDLTMLDIEEDEGKRAEQRKQIIMRHQEYRKEMFAKLFMAPQLTQGQAETVEELILSSSIDIVDAQILISVLMLACLNVFDPGKADILYNVYSKAEKQLLKQRAIVAYLLSTVFMANDYDLTKNPVSADLLATVQRQLLHTIDTPRVDKIMQQEIMPDIIKNSEFDFKNNRIIRKERDRIDEIINPNKDEEQMEKLEGLMEKMRTMQEQGNDLFFSGFRHVKNHPFFNHILNWFCPFYLDHPQIPAFSNGDDFRVMSKMVLRTPFCDSDKYSFIVAMQQAVATIPDDVKKMVLQGEAHLDVIGGDVERNDAFVRRIYMQDIFRFFKLCPLAKNLRNPIEPMQNSMFLMRFLNTEQLPAGDAEQVGIYDASAISVCKTLRKLGNEELLNNIIQQWKPQSTEGRIFKAFLAQPRTAIPLLQEVLKEDGHNVQALFGLTKACFQNVNAYRKAFAERKDAALNALLALYFKNENDGSVLNTLVKAYILTADNEKAIKYAKELIEKGKADNFIYIFLGAQRLAEGRIKSALKYLKHANAQAKNVPAIFAQTHDMGFNIPEVQQDLIENYLCI